MDEAPQVVVVGAACRDLVDDDPRGWRLGGGASYAALALARLGLRVGALVVADDEAAASTELRLVREAGVDLRFVPGARGPDLHQRRDARRAPPALPAGLRPRRPGRAARRRGGRRGAWMLAPVAAEIGDAWADVPTADALVAVGWQGLLRVLGAGEPVDRPPRGPSPGRPPGRPRRRRARRRRARTRRRSRWRRTCTPARRCCSPTRHAAGSPTRWATAGPSSSRGPGRASRSAATWTRSAPATRSSPAVFAAWIDPSITAGWDGPDPDLRLGAACASLVLEGPGVFAVPDREAAATPG